MKVAKEMYYFLLPLRSIPFCIGQKNLHILWINLRVPKQIYYIVKLQEIILKIIPANREGYENCYHITIITLKRGLYPYLPLDFFWDDWSPFAKWANSSVCCRRYFKRPFPLLFCISSKNYMVENYKITLFHNEEKASSITVPCPHQWQHFEHPASPESFVSSAYAFHSVWPFPA